MNVDAAAKMECKKHYIALEAQTNFVDVEPQKSQFRLTLNMDFENIKDPENLCGDISGLGGLGNGNVEVNLDDVFQLDDIVELVEQAHLKNK